MCMDLFSIKQIVRLSKSIIAFDNGWSDYIMQHLKNASFHIRYKPYHIDYIIYSLYRIVDILYSMYQYSCPLAVLNKDLGVSESVVQIFTEF